MGVSGYARVVPYIRILVSRLLSMDQLKEALQARSVDEVAAALRDSVYPGIGEARTIEDIEVAVWKGYFGVLEKVLSLSPDEARRPLLLYRRLEEAKDLLIILQSVERGGSLPERIPSRFLSDSQARMLLEALKESPGQRPEELAPSPRARSILEGAKAFESQARVPGSLLLYYVRAALETAIDAFASAKGPKRLLFQRVTCPRIKYVAVSGLLEAKMAGLEARLLDHLFPEKAVCGISWTSIRSIYEREEDEVSLGSALREIVGWRIEGESLGVLLETAKNSARLEAREAAEAAIASYPFQPGFIAGGIELLRLEAEDVVMIATATHLGLEAEDVAGRASMRGLQV